MGINSAFKELSTVTNIRVAHVVGNYLTSFFFLAEFLFLLICCFPLHTPQLITRLRQALHIGDFVEYQLLAAVLKDFGK
jgi:hypothetical protein